MSLSVLVVDDEAYVCRIVRLILENAGYKVFQATNVEAGLALLREEKPDALTVDLMMPGMEEAEFGGLELLIKKQSELAIREIPSIVLTAAGMKADHALKRAEDLGAKATLRKPFSRRQLIETMRKILA
jgi:CheY-like chemotaxis protein